MSDETKTPIIDGIRLWGDTEVVGKPVPRVDGYERVSGAATYTLDLRRPRMLHTFILRCPHAHARIKSIDTSRAEKMPGVHAIMTHQSPGANLPWYFDKEEPQSRLFHPVCRHEGEEVAAVAAETPFQAEDAARAIRVEYDPQPFVTRMEDAEKLSEDKAEAVGTKKMGPWVYERGKIDLGFKEADAIVEETFRTSIGLHTPVEIHNCVAEWDGDRLTIWDSTQGVFGVQQDLARTLKIPLSSVRVISHYMGGGFGSKLGLWKHGAIASLLAKKTGRPVRVAVPREDSFLCVGNRPADRMMLKAGVKKDGTLTALHMVHTGEVGAYPQFSVVGSQVRDLYLCPNVRTEETSYLINAGTSCAFRAPGHPQGAWALEQVMDALAEKIGMDPIELRLKNMSSVHQSDNLTYTSNGLKDCLQQGAERFGWKESRARARQTGHLVRGAGVAAGMWSWQGETRSTVIVKLSADGSVNLNIGAADLGTGTKTVMAMVVAEELGVPLEKIQIEWADTGTTNYAPQSGGSQTVLASAPAVRLAAVDVRKQLLDLAAAEMKCPVEELSLKEGRIVRASNPPESKAISELKSLEERVELVGVGRRSPHPAGKIALPFAAQFAEVEVNKLTGEVKVLRLLGAHDSGRMMNRLTYENQVFGGMTMGIGFALTERRILDDQTGKMVNDNWYDFKIPTALDVPAESVCVPIDPHDAECNNTGTKGLGEPAHIPTAAAIGNAIYNATGVRVTQLPITPMQMLTLLSQQSSQKKERKA